MNINSKTSLYAVLGYPIDYTLSPFIHNGIFNIKNENSVYISLPTKEEDFETFISFSRIYLKGFNITIPYKRTVLPFIDSFDKSALACDAVNTVKVIDKKLFGYNTDGMGTRIAIERVYSLKGKTVLIKGSGGAARGISAGLYDSDTEIFIDARNKAAADELIENIKNNLSNGNISIYDGKKQCDILINATPLGSVGNEGMPFSEKQIENSSLVFDAVYNPRKTVLLQTAEKSGKIIVNGLDMLFWQAVFAQEIWSGKIDYTKFLPVLEELKKL
jgi:shikimate dehydrogenase